MHQRSCDRSKVPESRGWVGGDSWFGSVLTAVEVKTRFNVHSTWIIKQNSQLYPKKPLHAILKACHGDNPAGHWVVMRSTIGGVPLFALAYAWSKAGVSYFLSTCGSTAVASEMYETNFEDEFGNIQTRKIPRPKVASFLYNFLPLIDEYNKQWQSILGLEKSWPTRDCWFRLLTTVIGMCVVDFHRIYRSVKLGESAGGYNDEDNDTDIDIRKFSDILCKDLKKRANRGQTNAQFNVSQPIGQAGICQISNTDGEHCRPVTATEAARHGRSVGSGRSQNCFVCRKYLKANGTVNYTTTTFKCACCQMPLCMKSRVGQLGRDLSCIDEHNQSEEDHLRCSGQFHSGMSFPKDKQVNLQTANV